MYEAVGISKNNRVTKNEYTESQVDDTAPSADLLTQQVIKMNMQSCDTAVRAVLEITC